MSLVHGGVQRVANNWSAACAGRSEVVEQRALPALVYDDGDERPVFASVQPLALRVALAFHLSRRSRRRESSGNQTAVNFQLFLAGATQADATALPLKMRPAATRRADKCSSCASSTASLALRAAGALGEDVENQAADGRSRWHAKPAPRLRPARQKAWLKITSSAWCSAQAGTQSLQPCRDQRTVRHPAFAATGDHAGRIRAGSGSQ